MTVTDAVPPQPWDRMPGETAKAFAAFHIYLELGPDRSIARAAHHKGRSAALFKRWSRQNDWVERAAAWEGEQAREADQARRQLRLQLTEAFVKDADQMRRLAMAKLGSLVRRDPITGEHTLDSGVTARDAVAMYRLAADLLGLRPSGAISPKAEESSDQPYLQGLSDTELQDYFSLLRQRMQDEDGSPTGGEQR